MTWGNGSSGVSGVVSSANSLVGTTLGDQVGSGGLEILPNQNYLVRSPAWSDSRGAVTWADGSSGVKGEISSANSLVGSQPFDEVGFGGITPLSNSNYLVRSQRWAVNRGAVSWGSGSAPLAGEVSASNSLVGENSGDFVGSGGITSLANGNFVVSSPSWNSNTGAVTWGSGSSGVSGVVSSANSLVGTSPGDTAGSGGVEALSSGHYLVFTTNWGFSNEGSGGIGAVTWGDGSAGAVGVIGPSNSLVGSSFGDRVGSGGFEELGNGNFVVLSPLWGGGASGTAARGAVTLSLIHI